MIFRNRLKEIEEEILSIRRESNNHPGIPVGNSYNVRRDQEDQRIDVLEDERKFILDRRNGWKPKVIWDVLVPIVVTVITTFIISKFISGI